jgi:hypothetical protein
LVPTRLASSTRHPPFFFFTYGITLPFSWDEKNSAVASGCTFPELNHEYCSTSPDMTAQDSPAYYTDTVKKIESVQPESI